MRFGKIAPFISLLILTLLTSFFGAFFGFFYKISEGEYAEYPRKLAKADTSPLFDYLQAKSAKVEVNAEQMERFISEIISENFASKKVESGELEQVPQIKIDGEFLRLDYAVKIPFMEQKHLSFCFLHGGGNFELLSAKLGDAKLPIFMARWALDRVISAYRSGLVFDMCRERLAKTTIKIEGDKFVLEEFEQEEK